MNYKGNIKKYDIRQISDLHLNMNFEGIDFNDTDQLYLELPAT